MKRIPKQTRDISVSLNVALRRGNVAFFGYKGEVLPDFIFGNRTGKTRVFTKNIHAHWLQSEHIPAIQYGNISEIREHRADIYFLDNEAVKVLFAEFPATAQFVFVRLIPRWSWLIALPGLLRRMRIGLVRVRGVQKFQVGGNYQRWLVIEHLLTEVLHTRLSLSADIGVKGFIEFLKEENVNYVVMRFYEKLPHLYREGGDLDILVSDDDERKIKSFLQENPGPIGVDVWTVSRPSNNGITYYPPPLARKVLESAIYGPAGARIPSPREAFLALAYHVVYHKGLFAGVKSQIKDIQVNPYPENNYRETLERMAKNLNIGLDITMESLDEYLAENGWRPKIDTLAKIAPRNEWVWRHFFFTEPTQEIGLGVFIIKQKAFDSGFAEKILNTIRSHKGFTILRTKKFSEKEIPHIAEQLRGGVWAHPSGNQKDFMPAMAVVVLDKHIAQATQLHGLHIKPDTRIKHLKGVVRGMFDTEKTSLVHSTDNTQEAWEYIEGSFPSEIEIIREEVRKVCESIQPSWSQRLHAYALFAPRYVVYRLAILKERIKSKIVRTALR